MSEEDAQRIVLVWSLVLFFTLCAAFGLRWGYDLIWRLFP